MPSLMRTIPLLRAFWKRAALCWRGDLRTMRLRTDDFWIHFFTPKQETASLSLSIGIVYRCDDEQARGQEHFDYRRIPRPGTRNGITFRARRRGGFIARGTPRRQIGRRSRCSSQNRAEDRHRYHRGRREQIARYRADRRDDARAIQRRARRAGEQCIDHWAVPDALPARLSGGRFSRSARHEFNWPVLTDQKRATGDDRARRFHY